MSDFDELHELDGLIGPLRSPATPTELAAENDVVHLMAAAHHSSKGNTMFTTRRARVATLIAAGIIGFGGVAAAGPAAYSMIEDESPPADEVEEQVEPAPVEEQPVVEEVVETDDAEESVEDEVVEIEDAPVDDESVEDEPSPEVPADVDLVDEEADVRLGGQLPRRRPQSRRHGQRGRPWRGP